MAADSARGGQQELPRNVVHHVNQGIEYERRGELEGAMSAYRLAQVSAVRVGSVAGEALACGHLALVAKHAGDTAAARQCLGDYLALTEAIGMEQAEQEASKIEIGLLQGVSEFEDWMLQARVAGP